MDLEFAKFSTECKVVSDLDILVPEEDDLPIEKGPPDLCNLLIRNVAIHSDAADLCADGGRHGVNFEGIERVMKLDGAGHGYSLGAGPADWDSARMPEICPIRIAAVIAVRDRVEH